MLLSLIFLLLPPNPTLSVPGEDARFAFFGELQKLCDSRFEGHSSFPDDPDDSFYGKLLIAQFKQCSPTEIRISFQVGEDTSRTWIFTKSDKGVLFKHDHRHKDGTPDEITDYGGWANHHGTAHSQFFPADAHTAKLIPAATTNVWNMQLHLKENKLVYYLERHGKPRFKAVLHKK